MDFERLVARHKDSVYRQMVRVCGNESDAEDALAEALVSAFRASEQLRDPAQFRNWVARIGTRACTRIKVKDQLLRTISIDELEQSGLEIPDARHDAGREAQAREVKRCVTRAIDDLPEIYKDAYVRLEVQQVSLEAVAEELGLSIPALKSRLHRARKTVRQKLDASLGCADLAGLG